MTRLARLIAVALVGACLAMTAFSFASLVLPENQRLPDRPSFFDVLSFSAIFVMFPAVGAVVAWRRPRNPIGWLFILMGLGITMSVFSSEYAGWATWVADLPADEIVAWAGTWAWTVSGSIGLPLALMLFPDGTLPGPRWRPVAALVVVAATVVGIAYATQPGQMDGYAGAYVNPFGIGGPAGDLATGLANLDTAVTALACLLGLAAMAARFRRGGSERQQVKWLLYPASLLLVGLVAAALIPEGPWFIVLIALAAIPACAGIAILRYRLYDIDVVIRRTLVYALVIAVLGAVYVASVLGTQAMLAGVTGAGPLPVALSTLAIAALFGPVRARVRDAVDRRFYRSRYSAQRTLEAFSGRLRDEVELDAVGRGLVDAAGRTVRPASAGVWIRARAGR